MELAEQKSLDGFTFVAGAGKVEARELCVMSAVAYIAGESHGDHPICTCPVLTELAILLNDAPWWADAEERTAALKPLSTRLVGTRGSGALASRRAARAAAMALRVWAPNALESAARALEAAGLNGHAAKMVEHAAKMRAAEPSARYAVARAAADYAIRYADAAVAAAAADYAARYAAASATAAAATAAVRYAADAARYAARYDAARYAAASASASASAAAAARYETKRQSRDQLLGLINELVDMEETV